MHAGSITTVMVTGDEHASEFRTRVEGLTEFAKAKDLPKVGIVGRTGGAAHDEEPSLKALCNSVEFYGCSWCKTFLFGSKYSVNQLSFCGCSC